MGIKKNLYFDNVNLADYGVYITGEAVYNAPERDVEIISIPARNGDYVIDNGRFNNITVTYPAGIFDYDAETFASRISEIRNFLASKKGYKKITDDYNPNEFRYGFFVGGFEVSPVANNTAGEFEISFNCKPQRFLTSGETEVSLASGDTITNPSLFDSKPLLEVFGYGILTINGHPITITGGTLGEIILANASTGPYSSSDTTYFNQTLLNAGDTITLKSSSCFIDLKTTKNISSITTTATTGNIPVTIEYNAVGANRYAVSYITSDFDFVKGTNTSETTIVSSKITYSDSSEETFTNEIKLVYNANYNYISFRNNFIGPPSTSEFTYYSTDRGEIIGVSTQSVLGNPIYIDCEEIIAYKIENDSYISLNQYVTIPDPVPVLTSGENEIDYDNTITNFKIVPRWWII